MKIVVSHPTGNRNVRAVTSSFFEAGILERYGTTISIRKENKWLRLLPSKIKNELLRRSFQLPEETIWTHPLRETARIILPKLGWQAVTRHEEGWASVDSVYQDFDAAFAKEVSCLAEKGRINAVYCYEDGALQTFLTAKQYGLKCIYDLPIAYWQTLRELLTIEAERMPEWKRTLGGGIKDSQNKLNRKTKELELADIVVTPSQFVIDSIPNWAKQKKYIMSPFGSPELDVPNNRINKASNYSRKYPLRVLFAGSMSQRKGLGDLMKAMSLLNSKDVELVIMGSLLDSMEFYRNQFPQFIYEPVRPHLEVLALMKTCDVFCLPSIVEGRALVIQEAMSQGLPIVITPNTGGTDLVIEGETGFLVPVGSPEIIASRIKWFLDHRGEIEIMGNKAKAHAATYRWEQYGIFITTELKRYIDSTH